MEWKTIDSAPKDGTDILINADGHCYVSWFDKMFIFAWMGLREQKAFQEKITHWMPLPPPTQERGMNNVEIIGGLTKRVVDLLANKDADLTAARECIRDLAFQLGVCAELAEHYVPGNGGLTAAKARATLAKHKAEIEKSGTKPTLPR